jgi:hypothetical protein
MINTVRNTVLSVLNKNNYGYLSPSDFNLFAKQAQLDLFESYFYSYNYQINKENARSSGTGYADITKTIEEAINVFSETKGLINEVLNKYYTPSETTTGDDYYMLNKVLVYADYLVSGITTGSVGGGNQVIDSAATFTASVSPGDIVAVENGGVQYVTVVNVVSDTTLLVAGSFFDSFPRPYTVYQKGTKLNEAEKVTHSKITMLNNSMLISPSILFPAYTLEGAAIDVYPDTVNVVGRVLSQYIRYPKDPNWTYVSLTNGEPSFDASNADYQDFELPLDAEADLVVKILQYAGVSIREADVYNFGQTEEQKNNQEEL